MQDFRNCLARIFGFPEYRSYQSDAIHAVMAGRDVSICMATGSGKSIIYQFPPVFARENGIKAVSIVISPLIALMQDQVNYLNSLGVSAGYIGGNQPFSEEIKASCGDFSVLYCTPEKVCRWEEGLTKLASTCRILLIAVDEAHCICEWGHDFRPEYRDLYKLRVLLADVPMVALTATADQCVRKQIVEQLRLRNHLDLVGSFNRKNLFYQAVLRSNDKLDIISTLLLMQRKCDAVFGNSAQMRYHSTLIYVRTRREAESLCDILIQSNDLRGLRAGFYHAGMALKDREAVHRRFLGGAMEVVVSTIAFGMGIHKADIRIVINFGLPKSIGDYYQQTGRAGRDGLPAFCCLLYHRNDITKSYSILSLQNSHRVNAMSLDAEANYSAQLYKIFDYATTTSCRRKYLLSYFGEDTPDVGNACNCCDNCSLSCRQSSSSVCLASSSAELIDGFYGIGVCCLVLTGSTEKLLLQRVPNCKSLVTYGRGRGKCREWWRSLANIVIGERYGLLKVEMKTASGFAFEKVSVSEEGRKWLEESQNVSFVQSLVNSNPVTGPVAPKQFLIRECQHLRISDHGYSRHAFQVIKKNHISSEPCITNRDVSGDISNYDIHSVMLRKKLLNLRTEIAFRLKVSPYSVLATDDIEQLVSMQPKSSQELKGLTGWTAWKINSYGDEFCCAISEQS